MRQLNRFWRVAIAAVMVLPLAAFGLYAALSPSRWRRRRYFVGLLALFLSEPKARLVDDVLSSLMVILLGFGIAYGVVTYYCGRKRNTGGLCRCAKCGHSWRGISERRCPACGERV